MKYEEATGEMGVQEPHAALVEEPGSRRWRIELRDLKTFRKTLGADVVAAFCACFVQADRLISLSSFGLLSRMHYPDSSPGSDRNLHTMVWFAVGTLREIALAIRALRSALAKRGLLDATSDAWNALQEIEERWDGDPFFRDVRNKIAFHIDLDMIEAGLVAMEADGNAILSEGYGREVAHSRFPLGHEALLRGSGKNPADIERFIKTVSEDHGAIHQRIQEVFLQVLDAKGIPYGPQ